MKKKRLFQRVGMLLSVKVEYHQLEGHFNTFGLPGGHVSTHYVSHEDNLAHYFPH